MRGGGAPMSRAAELLAMQRQRSEQRVGGARAVSQAVGPAKPQPPCSSSPELQRAEVRAAMVHRRSCKVVLVVLQAVPGSCKRFQRCFKPSPPDLQIDAV
jgi:hypothetical protein